MKYDILFTMNSKINIYNLTELTELVLFSKLNDMAKECVGIEKLYYDILDMKYSICHGFIEQDVTGKVIVWYEHN